ncbi:hypothetical protein J3F84DRAFT_354301 [Trichoderma pleuroticola]
MQTSRTGDEVASQKVRACKLFLGAKDKIWMMRMPLPASNENASYIPTSWSSGRCYSTGVRNHRVPFRGMNCATVESDLSIPSSVANHAASITETTALSPNSGLSNMGEHNYKHIRALLFTSDLSISSLSVHDERKRDNVEDQIGDILPAIKAVNNIPARCHRRKLCLVRAAAAKYKCATQSHGCAEIRIGWDGEIPRWRRGSELSYVVCVESFPAPLSSVVEDSMKAAVGMFDGIGVSFRQVARNDPATFAVIYESRNRNAYAFSFFPNESSRELIIYPPSLQKASYLSNILAHEVGHILGLRHEFAYEKENEYPSALFGSENADSIMNYFDHPKRFQVRKQDLEELERFYAYDKVKYGKLSILDVNPEVWYFGKKMTSPSSSWSSNNPPVSSIASTAVDERYGSTCPYLYWLGVSTTMQQRADTLVFPFLMLFTVSVITGVTLFLLLQLPGSSFLFY